LEAVTSLLLSMQLLFPVSSTCVIVAIATPSSRVKLDRMVWGWDLSHGELHTWLFPQNLLRHFGNGASETERNECSFSEK